MWADLDMPSGYAYGKTLPHGEDLRRHRLLPLRRWATRRRWRCASSRRYQGLESPAKMKLAVAGCPRNCSEALVKDVGVVAVGDDRWEVYVGGAAGASVRRGDVLATVDGHDEVIRLTGVFMQYYRENAQLAGAHVRLRAAGRARRAQGDPGRRPRRHRRRPGGADAGRRSTPTATRGRTGANRRARASSRTTCRCSRCRSCRSAGRPTGACRRRRRVAARRRADRSRAGPEPCRDYSERAGAQA